MNQQDWPTCFQGINYQECCWRSSAILVLVAALSLLGCGGSGGATVTLRDLTIDPHTVTIKKGESVTWNNEDRRIRQIMSGAPPVMTDDFMSPELDTGQSWSHTFDQAGEFPYHDMKIPGQLGTVIVEE